MVDIHTHILPGVDDGARTIEQALEMLRQAYRSGTQALVLTPHCAPAYGFFTFEGDLLEERFQKLFLAVRRAEIPLKLYPGMEVLYEGAEEFALHAEDYVTLCGSRYLLIEFPFDTSSDLFLEGIGVAAQYGYVPVVAHPERYPCVSEDIGLAVKGRAQGALLQLNKGSLSGRYGQHAREAAHTLLRLDVADFIASDAHHFQSRNSRLDRVFCFVESEYGEQRALRLFVDNPRRIIKNQPVEY